MLYLHSLFSYLACVFVFVLVFVFFVLIFWLCICVCIFLHIFCLCICVCISIFSSSSYVQFYLNLVYSPFELKSCVLNLTCCPPLNLLFVYLYKFSNYISSCKYSPAAFELLKIFTCCFPLNLLFVYLYIFSYHISSCCIFVLV